MAGVNKVIILGNLGADPEVRYTPGGVAICSFRVATSEKWKDKDGNQNERTEWHSITAFDKLAEICGQYLKKGSKCFVEGKLKTDKYQKEGQDHYSTKIIAATVQFLDKKEGGQSEPAGAQDNIADVDDIPF